LILDGVVQPGSGEKKRQWNVGLDDPAPLQREFVAAAVNCIDAVSAS
jgi:hypothetical protein